MIFAGVNRNVPGDSGIVVVMLDLSSGAIAQSAATFSYDSAYSCTANEIVYDACRNSVYVAALQRVDTASALAWHPVVCKYDTALSLVNAELRFGFFRDGNSTNCIAQLNNGKTWVGGGIGRQSFNNEAYIFELDSVPGVPQILVSGNIPACPGDSVLLTASGSGPYLWTTGDTTQSIVVNVAGNYQVQEASSACSSMYSAPANFTNHAVTVPVISYNFPDFTSSPGITYQWYMNGNLISGATSQTFTPTSNGTYEVEVTDANGCTAMSSQYLLTDVGIANPHVDSELSLQPNPASANVLVTVSGAQECNEVHLHDVMGRTLLQVPVTNDQLESGIEISLDGIGVGIYFVVVTSDNGSYVQKLVVDR